MQRVILFIIGFVLLIMGNFYIILYSNLFTFWDDILQYLFFLAHHKECYSLLLGLIIMIISIFMKGK